MNHLGRVIKQQRMAMPLTLTQVADASGVSSSHLGRIERGERFPSATILRRIARPLGFDESELFTLAGFLSPIPTEDANVKSGDTVSRLDPYVAKIIAEKPVAAQRALVGILSILESMAEGMTKENLQG